ncbi:MAG TPA: sigma-54 dependent transcriptional regulator [Myxococcota bacterium]|nr:sigma-54 dependent transcriptional regulator [Myxococcota bacterium]
MTRRLLIVDDDSAMREMLASLFKEHGLATDTAESFDAAVARLGDAEYDAVLSDIKMPGRSGIELVGELRRLRPETPIVLMTAFGSIDSAVEAMRAGAFDYVTKPFEPEAVLFALERAFERRELERENRSLRRALDRTSSLGELIGESPAMRDIFALVRRVANGRSSVLIRGESGTGKEVVARTLHFAGPRAAKPFVPINCTAIPEGLLESELFGHVRGAFTGAHASKVGLFEKANGGTLFLDEIGDMGPGLQSKLLRVLQDREVRPVGGTQAVKVDVRIVAATHKDLEAEIAAGRFREDLFYRLNVIPIDIPPLRERPQDIAPLVKDFLRRHDESGRRSLSHAALERLASFPWRGNARELENTIERALALCENEVIDAGDLPLPAPPAKEGEPAAPDAATFLRSLARERLSLHDLQEHYIDAVLEETQGNRVQAARILGLDRKTLYRRAERRRHEG